MKKLHVLFACLVAGLAGASVAVGQIAGGEARSDLTPFNLASSNGVPISITQGNPPGSSGKAPTLAEQEAKGLTLSPPTAGQYQGFVAMGGGVGSRLVPFEMDLTNVVMGGAVGFTRLSSTNELDPATWRSRSITHNQRSDMSITLTNAGTLAFSWKVSSQERFDYLECWQGTTLVERISGETDWAVMEMAFPRGTHTIRWSYVKDGSLSTGLDAGWVAGIRFRPMNSTTGTYVLPKVEHGGTGIVMKQARVGVPYVSKALQQLFGSVVAMPLVDEAGQPLTGPASDYWAAEPYWPATNKVNGEHVGAPYYWSRHARTVFANTMGQIEVAWQRLAPIPGASPTNVIYQNENYAIIPPFVYPVRREKYSVASSPVKASRRMYWTEGSFKDTGQAVQVPDGVIINFAYNNNFPKRVAEMYRDPGDSPRTETNAYEELRTIYYDVETKTIRAYNHQGRILLELLGDMLEGDRRQHIGIEVVDVVRRVNPETVVTELGEKVKAWQDGAYDDSHLLPVAPITQVQGAFVYEHHRDGDRVQLYAVRETTSLNDCLLHWLEEGLQGLRWPYRYTRNQFVWPRSIARYHHYMRPTVASRQQAALSAIAIPLDNVPMIMYQDPLDQPRAFMTESSAFYTWLTPTYPAHRTLLRYMSGDDVAFERVFSWLYDDLYSDTNGVLYATNGLGRVMGGYLQRPVYTNAADFVPDLRDFQRMLVEWDPYTGSFTNTSLSNAPRVVNEVVYVGDRIIAPDGDREPKPGAPYWAGHIRQDKGISFHPAAYVDPLAYGFEAANMGAIIPVNAIPGNNRLEIWWFRSNGSDERRGFLRTYWPSVVGRYTLQWPENPREIVLASNDGTGPLMSLEAKGSIYYNNVPGSVGYNPNEEHALMIGGQGYALRDDLNITTPGENYTSEPFVLVEFTAADGRPDIAAFKVLREKPSAGLVFDYIVEAGTILQAPMPLPLLPPPAEKIGVLRRNYNKEVATPDLSGASALRFTGTNYITINSVFGINQTATLECWVYLPSTNEGGSFIKVGDNGGIGIGVGSGSHNGIGNELIGLYEDAAWLSSGKNIGTGWQHVAFVVNNGNATLYLNGSPVYANNTTNPLAASGVTRIGAGSFATRRLSNGTLDEVRIWNVARTQGEIQASMNRELAGNEEGLVSYHRMNAGPGTPDLPGGWDPAVHGANNVFSHYAQFTFRDRKEGFWVYRGLNAGEPALQAGSYNVSTRTFAAPSNGVAVAGEPFRYVLHTSQRTKALTLRLISSNAPVWLLPDGVALAGTPPANLDASTNELTYTLSSTIDGTTITQNWTLVVLPEAVGEEAVVAQGPLVMHSINDVSGTVVEHIGRPPYLAGNPVASNSFAMRFYYKTMEGFAWPGIPVPPAVGTIVPYLRPYIHGSFVGAPDSTDTESLDIIYRPVWPATAPGMRLGDTLLTPKEGLPAVSGQTSLQILYQQSVASNLVNRKDSVVLHDSTREKEADLRQIQDVYRLPDGIRKDTYQGKVYFPNLPPHLVERVFFDPNRGLNGRLVLKGEFRDEIFGADYLMLNVLAGSDLSTVIDLCPVADPGRSAWTAMVTSLAARVETFVESAAVPGTYIPSEDATGPRATRSVGVSNVVEIVHQDTAVDSYALSASGPGIGYITLIAGGGEAFTPPADPVSVHIIRIEPSQFPGELKVVQANNPLAESLTFQHTPDLGGRFDEYEYDWRIAAPVDGLPPPIDEDMTQWFQAIDVGLGLPRFVLGGANIRTLSDNYVVVRYRPKNTSHPLYNVWSRWTEPMLAEGWIKRVLAGINPFSQRVTDLYNNEVSSDVSMLTQAGRRWEGDVALNMENINNFGLIEIYETVLNRGRMLSIDAGINYGPANDALLLASGYLNDLYGFLGGEAYADAANPTIGIGTADREYGDVATSMFAFQGQAASLLEEELALLRGRDDILMPGTRISPVYNRLIWNYTRGIAAGEVIYALNYNVKEKTDGNPTGVIGAKDAAYMYPQGHGDAYGHYLMAAKNYWGLLMSPDFTWVPRIEAVLVLGQPVSVDYLDERKFAASALAWARTGREVFDLTWRRDYNGGTANGWRHFGETRTSTRTGRQRYWSMSHWATRVGIGNYVNWIMGNAILPDVDPDPTHEGIQKVDRTTVLELGEMPAIAEALQSSLNSAEAGLTPLGLPQGGLAFDISPTELAEGRTHFEQVLERATRALNTAVIAFDDAKDVTRLMRTEQDTLADLQAKIALEEFGYETRLIEIYGTPYPDDIGPGKTYRTGYDGPDFVHYMYVELPQFNTTNNVGRWMDKEPQTWKVSIQQIAPDWLERHYRDLSFFTPGTQNLVEGVHYIDVTIQPHGFFGKPDTWTGRRRSPGELQQVISEYIAAHYDLVIAVNGAQDKRKWVIKKAQLLLSSFETDSKVQRLQTDLLIAQEVLEKLKFVNDTIETFGKMKADALYSVLLTAKQAVPLNFIAGMAAGGDMTSMARASLESQGLLAKVTYDWIDFARKLAFASYETAQSSAERWRVFLDIDKGLVQTQDHYEKVSEFSEALDELNGVLEPINIAMRQFDDAQRKYMAKVAEGDRILRERELFRRRSASIVQGYRTRDAAFRLFRNEKLERYKTLFDLSARYAFIAAQAYDYETGLLGTPQGQRFIDRIVNSRALGVVEDGQPQFAGSNMGDPGLSSVLAEMTADWSVLKGRLGFNNPDGYGTTVSLRNEKFRIPPGATGDNHWRDVLQRHWMENILDDVDVRTHAMQVEGEGLAVPGIVIPFGTAIAAGANVFGLPGQPGDHAFNPSAFATKIYAVGVALPGYVGMDDPATTAAAVGQAGGVSPADPTAIWLNPDALMANPYVYLIPTGLDSMRSPPLGDESRVRTWDVRDVTLPLPFNIGASEFSTLQWWQSSDFLTEDMFSVRKHQAFRPVSHPSVFSYDIYGAGGYLKPSPFTNSRLIGRSVWNSQWKLVIPGNTLLFDGDEGLRRFIRTVNDICLHFVTYSYSGN